MSERRSRSVRRPVDALPSTKLALIRAVIRAERFAELDPGAAGVLLVCLVEWSDGAGRFWPKYDLIAQWFGVSDKTISRALTKVVASGLFKRERYQRPDGRFGTWLYEPADISVRREPPADTSGGSAGPDNGVPWAGPDRSVGTDQNFLIRTSYLNSAAETDLPLPTDVRARLREAAAAMKNEQPEEETV
jgi:Helix-turn-helix domain